MKVLVDADACPSIDLITDTCIKYNVELILYADTTHNIVNNYAKVITISKGFQSVDMVIINEIKENDILVTQDYGLALLSLTKKAKVINPKGMIYTNDNIDKLLYEKYVNSKLRKQSKHIKGPKKRTAEDDDNLINNLIKLITT